VKIGPVDPETIDLQLKKKKLPHAKHIPHRASMPGSLNNEKLFNPFAFLSNAQLISVKQAGRYAVKF